MVSRAEKRQCALNTLYQIASPITLGDILLTMKHRKPDDISALLGEIVELNPDLGLIHCNIPEIACLDSFSHIRFDDSEEITIRRKPR